MRIFDPNTVSAFFVHFSTRRTHVELEGLRWSRKLRRRSRAAT
jgi:hypothetical protein